MKNCSMLAGCGDGIVLEKGILDMSKSHIIRNEGTGLRVIDGYASLNTCAITGNALEGIRNENGVVILHHCGVVQNSAFDLYSSQFAVFEATSTAMGAIAPDSALSVLQHSLVEDLHETTVIEKVADSPLNVPSGLLLDNGRLIGLSPPSACVNAGLSPPVAPFDIDGNPREDAPDIGPLEYFRPMALQTIRDFHLKTRMNADRLTPNDSLELVLRLRVPENFALRTADKYSVTFGNYTVSSEQFRWPSLSSDRTLLTFSDNDGSSPNKHQLEVTLALFGIELYDDIAQFVLSSRMKLSSTISRVYLPIRVGTRGLHNTGEEWVSFELETQNSVGKGSAARINSGL